MRRDTATSALTYFSRKPNVFTLSGMKFGLLHNTIFGKTVDPSFAYSMPQPPPHPDIELPNPIPRSAARTEMRLAGLSLAVGVFLLVLKFTAYYATGSSAIFSDALESIVNVLASAFALYSISVAHLPADREHPYGHGKVEFMSAGIEGAMILLAGLVILGQAVGEMVSGPQVEKPGLGIVLIGTAFVVNGVTGALLLIAGRRNGSITLEADGKHLLSDAVTSVAVVTSLLFVHFLNWKWADPIAAAAVSFYLIYLSYALLRRSAAGLMDEQDADDDRMITALLDAHLAPSGTPPMICSYHHVRHRHSGRYHWIDFHIRLPADMSIEKGHAVASAIEYEIERALGYADATAHIEPCADAMCGVCGEGNHEIRNPDSESLTKAK